MSLFLTVGAMAQDATTYENGVYKIFWDWDDRGYLTYHADYPNDPQLAGVTLGNYGSSHYSLNDAGIQLSWYLYTSETTGKTYLIEATTGKFVTIDLNTVIGNGKKCVLSSEVSRYAQFVLKATTNIEAYMLSYENYNFCSGCGSAKGNNPVRFATDGQTDGGIPFVFVADGASITDEVKNAAIAKIDAYERGNSAAKAELETAITNAQALLGQITIGEGVGKYTGKYTAAEIESELGNVKNFYNSIDESTPVETIEAYTAKVNEAIASYLLNMPKAGKYYRLKGASGNYIDASAIYNNADATAGQMSMKSADDCYFNGTVFYLDENSKLLNYHTQTYITATREIAASVEAGGNTWTFSASSIVGKYKIKSNDNNWLHDNSGNRADRCNQDPADHAGTHSWILEEVVIESEETENPDPENPDPENPTAVENVEAENENVEIYDLTGRKVENVTKAGVYIINGNKVLVK